MINEKMTTNAGARVKIHSCSGMSPLGHNSWDEGYLIAIQLMSHSLHCNGLYERIGNDNFVSTQSCRIAVVGRINICSKDILQIRYFRQQGHRQLLG